MSTYQTDRPISIWTGSDADYWRQLRSDPVPIFSDLTKAQLAEWMAEALSGGDFAATDYSVLRKLMRERKSEVVAFVIVFERERMDSLNDRRSAVRATKIRRSQAASN